MSWNESNGIRAIDSIGIPSSRSSGNVIGSPFTSRIAQFVTIAATRAPARSSPASAIRRAWA